MSIATCRCMKCATQFTSRVVEDSPDINYVEVKDSCPNCGGEELAILEVNYDED